MQMQVKKKNWAEKFVEWVFSLPNYQAIIFMPAVILIYFAAVIKNKIQGE